MRPSDAPELRLRLTVLDSADHRRLAEFYRQLLGAHYRPGSEPGQDEEPRFIELHEPTTGASLAFQISDDYQAPDWPHHRQAQTQAHLDFDVTSARFDAAVEMAVSLGARVLSTAERDDGLVVLSDPAGHPFCLIATD